MIVIGEQTKRQPLPARIETLFAAAEKPIPSRGPIPIHDVDAALKGLDVEDRLYLKSRLRELGYLA